MLNDIYNTTTQLLMNVGTTNANEIDILEVGNEQYKMKNNGTTFAHKTIIPFGMFLKHKFFY